MDAGDNGAHIREIEMTEIRPFIYQVNDYNFASQSKLKEEIIVGVRIVRKKKHWDSADDMTVVDGLITVTRVKGAQTFKLNKEYDLFEVPDNGRSHNNQMLTKVEGGTATFSAPSR